MINTQGGTILIRIVPFFIKIIDVSLPVDKTNEYEIFRHHTCV